MGIGFTDRRGLMPQTQVDRHKPVTLVVAPVRATREAILVRDGAGTEAWLPRRHIISLDDGIRLLRVTLPTWLAIEKGLRADADAGQARLF